MFGVFDGFCICPDAPPAIQFIKCNLRFDDAYVGCNEVNDLHVKFQNDTCGIFKAGFVRYYGLLLNGIGNELEVGVESHDYTASFLMTCAYETAFKSLCCWGSPRLNTGLKPVSTI